jgi:hypothetical protein
MVSCKTVFLHVSAYGFLRQTYHIYYGFIEE